MWRLGQDAKRQQEYGLPQLYDPSTGGTDWTCLAERIEIHRLAVPQSRNGIAHFVLWPSSICASFNLRLVQFAPRNAPIVDSMMDDVRGGFTAIYGRRGVSAPPSKRSGLRAKEGCVEIEGYDVMVSLRKDKMSHRLIIGFRNRI